MLKSIKLYFKSIIFGALIIAILISLFLLIIPITGEGGALIHWLFIWPIIFFIGCVVSGYTIDSSKEKNKYLQLLLTTPTLYFEIFFIVYIFVVVLFKNEEFIDFILLIIMLFWLFISYLGTYMGYIIKQK